MGEPYLTTERVVLYAGDCLDVMAELPDASVDAVVTDPPYGLGFMGREWDGLPPGRPWTEQCLRVLKPGGHMLAFGGTRTWHRLAVAVEDAGFEVRDSIAWMYGSGFPKSLDVSKAIDAAAGATRETRNGQGDHEGTVDFGMRNRCSDCGEPYFSGNPCTCPRADRVAVTEEAAQWEGWGTALKPAFEPIVVARKPLVGTVAGNVLAHGAGALNIDGCRIEGDANLVRPSITRTDNDVLGKGLGAGVQDNPAGRWPANVILDESQAAVLDEQSGETSYNPAGVFGENKRDDNNNGIYGGGRGITQAGLKVFGYGDTGGASRFFYVAKADASERVRVNGTAHPTVKPLELMRWLVRLVTPPGGTVLEPFAGSGTTVEACLLEGVSCIAIEREADYLPLIVQRINRRRDPVAAVKATAEDGGLFDLLGEDTA